MDILLCAIVKDDFGREIQVQAKLEGVSLDWVPYDAKDKSPGSKVPEYLTEVFFDDGKWLMRQLIPKPEDMSFQADEVYKRSVVSGEIKGG